VIVHAATHRGKSRAAQAAATPPDSDTGSDSATDTGSDTVPANESPLAERVQDEMFHRSDAVRPDA
jgi:hypothetical protein